MVRARRWVGDVEAVAAGEEEARGAGSWGRWDRGHPLAAGGWCWDLGAGTRLREQEVETKGRGCGEAEWGAAFFLGARSLRDGGLVAGRAESVIFIYLF